MLCLVRYLFVISASVIDCLGRFVPEMTYYVSSGTLNLTKLKLKLKRNSPHFSPLITKVYRSGYQTTVPLCPGDIVCFALTREQRACWSHGVKELLWVFCGTQRWRAC